MNNMPEMKVGIVAVSRDCFPESLSVNRRENLVNAYTQKYGKDDIYECPICIVESEIHMQQALEDIKKAGCNALCVYLGNFGPEISETMLAKYFDGPKMFVAAAEETSADGGLVQGRGDAYCGMLNASYNLKLRNVGAYIPEYPVGTAEECADMIHEFLPVARAVYGLNHLKIITFGPRPTNFLACNAPIQQLYNLGVEIEENSELDLFESFHKHAGDERIPAVVKSMEEELGTGNKKPEILNKLAQYELTLLDWVEAHKGSREFVAIAGKCWPAFQTQFGFVPCYVNSRLTAMGIPVSCEVDIYGALSEFIGYTVSKDVVTLLDINNSVPADIYNEDIKGKFDYTQKDTFMGFHCGNTAACKLSFHEMRNQMIMARSLPEEVTNGTLEGDIVPGDITFYRLQGTAEGGIRAYIAQGEVLPVATRSFGAIGIFAIPEMCRFYILLFIEKKFPHHGAVAFGHFQQLLADYPAATLHETIKNFHNTVDRFHNFLKAVEEDVVGRAKDVQAEIEFVKAREADCHIICDALANGEIPLRVTHNDTKLNNVMIDNKTGKGLCVIDLDTVMPGSALYDYGDSIRFGASTAAEDEQNLDLVSCDMNLFEIYTKGYTEGCAGSLTEKEIRLMPMGAKLMTLECGMRFLADHLQNDIYFKIHRENHNLDRARTQFKLVADMEAKWDQMNAIVEKYL